jgi:hypothetical protein
VELTFTDKSSTTITLSKRPERIIYLFFDALAELGLEPVANSLVIGREQQLVSGIRHSRFIGGFS